MQRILIYGNSGSGKTTLASQLSAQHELVVLDLDTITWKPDVPGVRLALADSLKQLEDFISTNEQWIIEGCYGSLIEQASAYCTELIFLHPGVDKCLSNNLKRPWEAHKYPSLEAQNKNLAFLQQWVRDYYTRDDEYSYPFHQRIYAQFAGPKQLIS